MHGVSQRFSFPFWDVVLILVIIKMLIFLVLQDGGGWNHTDSVDIACTLAKKTFPRLIPKV